MLDALMDAPLSDLLRNMNLTEDMRAALLSRSGEIGKILHCAEQLESGAVPAQVYLKLSMDELAALQTDALRWSDAALKDLGID